LGKTNQFSIENSSTTVISGAISYKRTGIEISNFAGACRMEVVPMWSRGTKKDNIQKQKLPTILFSDY
jgi:hypothetical protein